MAKSLNQFGGWLKFFYITQWIVIILCVVFTLQVVLLIFGAENTNEMIEFLFASLKSLITLILFIKIIKRIKKRDVSIPNQIVKLMTWVVMFTVIFAICEGFMYYLTLGREGLSNLTKMGEDLFRILIWYAIWASYFKKSQRVFSYYGKNAGKT